MLAEKRGGRTLLLSLSVGKDLPPESRGELGPEESHAPFCLN